MLLACVIITSVFSVTLTSKTSGGKNDRRLLASQASRQASSRLRNFVTGCDCDITTGICSVASCTINGPTPVCSPGTICAESWSFTYPAMGIKDCLAATTCGTGTTQYALKLGSHTILGMLPHTFNGVPFENPPYSARVIYFVSSSQTLDGRPVPAVSVNVVWTEPL